MRFEFKVRITDELGYTLADSLEEVEYGGVKGDVKLEDLSWIIQSLFELVSRPDEKTLAYKLHQDLQKEVK